MILFQLFISSFSIKHHIISCEPSNGNVFNICFLKDEHLIQTTSHQGYTLVARDNSDNDGVFISNQSAIFRRSIEITTVVKNISFDQVSVSHSFRNLLNTNNFIELAVYTSLFQETTCSAHVSIINTDGFYISNDDYELGLFFPKGGNYPYISSLWLGNSMDLMHSLFKDSLEAEFYGCACIAYSWKGIDLEPLETKTVNMLFLNSDEFPFDYEPPTNGPHSKSSTFTQKYTETQIKTTNTDSVSLTESKALSKSGTFSSATKNTITSGFTESQPFTKSGTFSFTAKNTITSGFTESKPFTKSDIFTYNSAKSKEALFPSSGILTSFQIHMSKGKGKSVSIPMIAGIFAGVIALVLIVILVVYLRKKRKYVMENKVIKDPETEPESFEDFVKEDLYAGL